MKTPFPFLAVSILSIMISAPLSAEESKISLPPEPKAPSAATARLFEEVAQTQILTDHYKKEAAAQKEMWAKRTGFFGQIKALREKMNASANLEEKKELQSQILDVNKQLGLLSEEMAKKDIESAEFNLKTAQRRLEKSKENLTRIQEANKGLAIR